MRQRQRAKLPVAVSTQQNQLILSIDPATLHTLGKLAIELVKLIAPKSTTVAPTVPAGQKIEPGGTLTIPYGTITLTSNYPSNIKWIDKQGNTIFDGGSTELFVLDNMIYLRGTDGIHYQRAGDYSGNWVFIDSIPYAVLKSTAKTIITPVTLPLTGGISP
jgi:hypothetical protein